MDDPWGSPWATTDPEKRTKPPSPSKSDLEPPPRAFLTNGTSSIPTISTQSPCATDDGGFGDWAAAEPAGGATGTSGWGGWTNGENNSSSQQLTPTPREDGFGGTSPIAWPGAAATSPGVKALSRSNSNSMFRQPSPDPWQTGFNFKEEAQQSPIPDDVRDPSPIRLDARKESPVRASTQSPGLEQPLNAEVATKPTVGTQESPWEAEEKQEIPRHEQPAQKDQVQEEEVVLRGTLSRSRRSSSCSEDSHRDDGQQDSPITSIDEDSRMRPQLSQRKASSKVQELVVMFDDMARPAEEPDLGTPPPKRIRQIGENRDDGDGDNEGDFGDFEDAEVVKEEGEEAKDAPSRVSTPTPKPREQEHGQRPEPEAGTPGQISRTAPSIIHELTDKFGPIHFDIDLDLVGQLCPDAGSPVDDALGLDGADSYVPDHGLLDSFTEISERKAWYRISRQGTMRRHNAGDDDSYTRVGWKASAVQRETLKIVRRWMEEDSLGGRPTLGGGGFKGNMFGWDSEAKPVALEEVFGRKKISQPKPRPLYQLEKPPAPPAAGTSVALQESHGGTRTKTSASAFPAPVAASGSASAATEETGAADDEDEWGEMVDAPQVDPLPPDSSEGFFATPGITPSMPQQDLAKPSLPPLDDSQKPSTTIASGDLETPLSLVSDTKVPTPLEQPIYEISVPETSSTVTPAPGDAWASADFSFFDVSSPGATSKTTQTTAPPSVPSVPSKPLARKTALRTPVSSLPTIAESSALPAAAFKSTAPVLTNQAPKENAFVAGVLANLPDLSYMLR